MVRYGISNAALVLSVFFLVFFSKPSQSDAAPVSAGWHNGHDRVSINIPVGSTRILVRGAPYYYADGVYYGNASNRYIIVDAPVGAVVPRLPRLHERVRINGREYFRHQGIYYARVRGGYEVVRPVRYVAPRQAVRVVDQSRRAYAVNIPYRGGYRQVVVGQLPRGYVGPRGEFYTRFPSADHLRGVYAR